MMTTKQIEALAYEIREYLLRHWLWQDVTIYFNGKALSTSDGKGNYGYNDRDKVFLMENKNPRDYFEYAGDILSMSFEGPFYDVLNYNEPTAYCDKIIEGFNAILAKKGLYYELGHAWNLTLYPL